MTKIELINSAKEANPLKAMAVKMSVNGSKERKEAEKMMGCKFEGMTKEQRGLACEMLYAFQGQW